jgi:LPS-assembly protein
LGLIILLAPLSLISHSTAAEQFKLGDNISIFSDKAYRKDGGEVFEAVGNVVVVSDKDTLYGESASFDRRTMTFRVDGNVRFITQEMTLYGSRLEYHALTGYADIQSARIMNPQFNIVARRIQRQSDQLLVATEAEFTACRDCTESWAVFGKKIMIYMNDRAEIYHGLAKIKGVSVLYLPYMSVPLSKRKSGLLFPKISNREGEGLYLEQPVFANLGLHNDATVTPTFWGKRGYGTDLEYRQIFNEGRWFEGNTRLLNDSIYLPGKKDQTVSGVNYTRYFADFENHWQWNPNTVHHFRHTAVRDLDVMIDHPFYTDRRVNSSDLGFTGSVDTRGKQWALSLQTEYLRNQLVSDPVEFDRSYVQTLPRIAFGTTPVTLVQTDKPFLRHISIGMDASLTRFRRILNDDTGPIRDADRFTANPYLNWHLFDWGPLSFKTEGELDFQRYRFPETDSAQNAEKNAFMTRTEMSFTMDRIFGLAYEEKVSPKELTKEELDEAKKVENPGPKPLTQRERPNSLVGTLPDFESSLTEDGVTVARHSYRHSQEFKFIHHYIPNDSQSGNRRFLNQIQQDTGWFDYTDAIRSQEYLLGSNITRTIVPPTNTVEFQWNNVLIKKEPKATDWRTDQRYLRDNFSYSKMSYFNVSQGYLLDQSFDDIRDRLTRLAIQGGFITKRWSLTFSEYFFHRNSQHIFQAAWQRQFDFLNLISAYNFNTFDQSINTLNAAVQIKPTDTLGFSYGRQIDFQARQDIWTIYSLDIMPHNNCWILNLGFEQSQIRGNRYLFNIMFNFGDDRFSQYRKDWFRAQRL